MDNKTVTIKAKSPVDSIYSKFSQALIDALELRGKNVIRMIIDCDVDKPVKIYVQLGNWRDNIAGALRLPDFAECDIEFGDSEVRLPAWKRDEKD